MIRFAGLILALSAALVAGACASGGSGGGAAVDTPAPTGDYPAGIAEPEDNEFTTRAGLFLAQMSGAEPAQREQLAQQALDAIQTGLQQDSLNPKLWLMRGQALVGAGDFDAAIEAFERAQEIYPAYEPQVEAEREQAWVQAFNQGVEAMQANDQRAAIQWMERAQEIYQGRPEALMNLASLYLGQDEHERAIQAYEDALVILNQPRDTTVLPAEVTADWDRFATMAEQNITQIYASQGVAAFRDEDYETAAQAFRRALERNPYFRDARQNLAQSLYVQTTELEEGLDDLPAAEQQARKARLREIYREFQEVAEQVRENDPYNANTLLLVARAYRGLGQLAEDDSAAAKQWQDRALAVLQEHEALPFTIADMQATLGEDQITLRASLENRSLDQGESVVLEFRAFNPDGNVAGTQRVTITAPAQGSATSFEVVIPAPGTVLGWTYERVGA